MPQDHSEKIYSLETKVSLLERDSQMQTKILDKLTQTVENIQDLTQAMHRLVSIDDVRFKNQDRENDLMNQMISDRRAENVNDIEQLTEDFKELKKTLNDMVDKLQIQLDKKSEKSEKLDASTSLEMRLKTFKSIVANWKYLGILTAFFMGIITHKWAFLRSLMGITE